MSLSHPVGDMVTRIRNGQNAGKEFVSVPCSKLRKAILNVLKEEGFIEGFVEKELGNNKKSIVIELKYQEGIGAIQEIKVVSKPGRRVYSKSIKIPKVSNGLGIAILSTSGGVMTDYKARLMNLGGEILCRVI